MEKLLKSGECKSFDPGSVEDIQLTFEIFQEFMKNKLKAIEMFRSGAEPKGTNNTSSICHVDGTTDCD